jgi:small GTP-binding protein
MKPHRNTTGILLLVVAAAAGVALLLVPPWVLEQYRALADAHPAWKVVYFTVVGIGAVLLLGSSGWIVLTLWRRSRRKAQRRERQARNPSELSASERRQELDENLAGVEELRGDPAVDDELRHELDPLVDRVTGKRERQTLEIVAFGTISSGKSSLLNLLAGRKVFQTDAKGGTTVQRNEVPWPGNDKVVLVDTPGLGEVDGETNAAVSAAAAKDADLVLLVVDGPLRDSEFQLLARLGEMEKRVLVCLNKEDWYEERQKMTLLAQIAAQVKDLVEPDDVLAVRAQPVERSRVRVLADGREVAEPVEVAADIEPLARRMMHVVRRDGSDLLLANLLLQSRGLVEEARRRVREALDRRAWQIVDRYMWGAAGAAALSPWPVVDLAAGCAISAKMVVDLSRVYRQDIDLESAVHLLGQMGKNLIAVLGATAATPAVAAGVASLLKTVPGVGTIAGGLLQGVVQALVTRWIGAVFIGYFAGELQASEAGLAQLARREWERLTTVAELRKLVQTARSRLGGE